MNFKVRWTGMVIGVFLALPALGQDTGGEAASTDTARTSLPFNYNYSFSKNMVTARVWNPLKRDQHLMLSGHFSGHSTNMVAGMMNGLVLDYKLDNGYIGNAVGKLKGANRAGADLGSELNYYHFTGSLIWYAGISSNNLFGSEYGADIFQLAFQGNAPFEGSNASLGGLEGRGYQYNQLRGGIVLGAVKDSTVLNFGIGLGINQGMQLLELSVPDGNLFTAPYGEYLDLGLQFEALYTEAGHFGTFNGKGASIDLAFSANKGNHQWVVQAMDIGFIAWNNLTHLTADTSLHFDGIEVTNLFSGGAELPGVNTDSLQNYIGVETSTMTKTTFNPALFRVAYARLFPSVNMYASAGVEYRMISGYWPMVFVKGEKYLAKPGMIGAVKLSYGGFGGFSLGLEARKQFLERIGVTVGTSDILGLVVPGSFTQSSLYAGIGVSF